MSRQQKKKHKKMGRINCKNDKYLVTAGLRPGLIENETKTAMTEKEREELKAVKAAFKKENPNHEFENTIKATC